MSFSLISLLKISFDAIVSRNDDREEGLWEWDDLLIREDDFLLGYNLFPNAKSFENFLKIFSAAGSPWGGNASTVGGVVVARTT